MASLSFIIGIIGNVISILVFLSPMRTFRKVVKKRSTEGFKGLPYVTTLLSTSLWSFYGLLKPGGILIVTVNGAGAVLQFIYVVLFLIYASRDVKIKYLKLVALIDVAALGLVIAVTLLALHGDVRLTFVGVFCAALTLGMYASPLSVMRTVIRMRSVEFMPFSLSFFLFLNGSVWSAYAVLVKDFYIGVPNSIGVALGSAQLILYVIYMNKSKSSKPTDEEEGSAHLVKDNIEMFDNDNEINKKKNRSLSKGRSLPMNSVSRQLSLPKIGKTQSVGPYELYSGSPHDENHVENGDAKHHP